MTFTGWRAYAVCADLPKPDVMFPDPSDLTGVKEARLVCAACPVKRECLEEALADEGGKRRGITRTFGRCCHFAVPAGLGVELIDE